MSDTPRTETYVLNPTPEAVPAVWARQLERELNAAQSTIRQQQLLDEEIMRLRERVKHITDGFQREQNDIIQTCGKALGYPRFCDDQNAFPGATEADGVCVGDHVAASIAVELASKYMDAMERVRRLEEAGDALASVADAAEDDIRQHLQVANYNLHGLINTGEKIDPPNPPNTIHQAGIDASASVCQRVRQAIQAWLKSKEAKP